MRCVITDIEKSNCVIEHDTVCQQFHVVLPTPNAAKTDKSNNYFFKKLIHSILNYNTEQNQTSTANLLDCQTT